MAAQISSAITSCTVEPPVLRSGLVYVQSARTLSRSVVAIADPKRQIEVDARLLWRAVLADLQQALPATAFEWLRHSELVGFASDGATIAVSDRVTAETLHRRFAPAIERALSERV